MTGTWVQPAPRRRRARRSTRSVGRCTCGHGRIRRTRDPRFLRNAIRLRGLPAIERAVGRSLQRTARSGPRPGSARTRRADAADVPQVLDDVIDETPRIGVDRFGRRRLLRSLPAPIAARVVGHAVYRMPRSPCARGPTMLARPARSGRRPPRTAARSVAGLMARRDREYVRLLALPPRRRRDGHRPGKPKSLTVTRSSDARYTRRATCEAYEPDIERVLITEDEIQAKLRELGEQITEDYAGRDLLLVGRAEGRVRGDGGPRRGTSGCRSSSTSWRSSSLRRGHEDLRRRPDPEGPRPRHRGPRRPARRGHRRLRPHAELPAEEPPRAQAREPRGGGAAAARRTSSGCRSTSGTRGSRSRPSSSSATAWTSPRRFRNLPYIATLRPEAYGGA